MTNPNRQWTDTGELQRIDRTRVAGMQARFDERLALADRVEEHVWTVFTVHLITDKTAALFAGEEDPTVTPILDSESLASIQIGCYRCEQPLDPRLIGRRCRGVKR